MYTNYDRTRDLENVLKALKAYTSPMIVMGDMPEGVDEDIYRMFLKLEDTIAERIADVNKLDLEEVIA